MSWVGTIISAFATFIFFFHFVRNRRTIRSFPEELCDLYLLNHMLPDGHPMEFMYKGLPRDRDHPHLLWPCVATFVCAGMTLIMAVLTVTLDANGVLGNEVANTIFLLICVGSTVATMLTFLGISEIQNHISYKKMMNMDFKQVFKIRTDIEKKWPGFYNVEK